MDANQFRRCGKEIVDYVAEYYENVVKQRPVFPPASEIQPGFMAQMLPKEAPQDPDTFESIVDDVNRAIIPGVTNWQSPKFFAYVTVGYSYPSVIADLLCDGLGCVGFSWASSPSCTELETVMMDWLAKMLELPEHFLFSSKGKGGGIIYSTACEGTLAALLAARNRAFDDCQEAMSLSRGNVLDRLVAFTSDQAHSSVERAGLLGAIPNFIHVQSDENHSMRGDALKEAIEKATGEGLIPFYVAATLGTTSTCAFDNLSEIGEVVEKYNSDPKNPTKIWLHVDAAYAGAAFCCSEFRPLVNGIEHVDSFSFNPHKLMLVTLDCSAMWFKDATIFADAFNVDPVYLKHKNQDSGLPDYRHWQLQLSRRFRSLKLFFVLRSYGVRKIQDYIRDHAAKAHYFEALVKEDRRFEVTNKVVLGVTCFRLKTSKNLDQCNAVNLALFEAIQADNRIHLTPTSVKGMFMLRLAIGTARTTRKDIDFAWDVIRQLADKLLLGSEEEAPVEMPAWAKHRRSTLSAIPHGRRWSSGACALAFHQADLSEMENILPNYES